MKLLWYASSVNVDKTSFTNKILKNNYQNLSQKFKLSSHVNKNRSEGIENGSLFHCLDRRKGPGIQ